MATIIAFLQHLSSPPHKILRIVQPTEVTVSYTVSTRPEAKTIPALLSAYTDIALRILVAFGAALLLWLKWMSSYGTLNAMLLAALDDTSVEELVHSLNNIQWRYLLPGTLLVLFLSLRKGYTEESLTVLRGLGLQTSTTSSIYLRAPTTRFIPTTSIQDIFINEAFKGFEVRFYLVVVVKGEADVVVVFPRLLPRRAVLEKVWRGARACLWEVAGKKQGNNESADVYSESQ